MNEIVSKSFHNYVDAEVVHFRPKQIGGGEITKTETKHIIIQERELSYRFDSHAHWFVTDLVRRLIAKGVPGLQAADTDYQKAPDGSIVALPDGKFKPVLYAEYFSPTVYAPSSLVQAPYPVKDLDFTSGGAYAVYNWELFFHVPLMIAMHLSKNQRFAESQQWFHYIFDPTDDSDGPTPERFWKVRPFQYTHVQKIEEILVNLATNADPKLRDETIRSIEAWKDAPFRPHVVARYRQQAYMFKTVMAYLDNLIAWGDSLFRQDTREAIDEAMIVYVLAANILGPRPQAVPRKGTLRPQTYASLREDLDKFGNTLRNLEADAPFDLTPHPSAAADNERMAVLNGLGKALYFCVPRNDKLLGYWDTVADRLFKIRNSLNIQGIFRQLPLFEPPIDPALLARAAAAGLDVGAIVSGLNQPLPLVRFGFLVQKAAELAQEVKSLGNALLTAMEKEDGEAMALLRAKQELKVLEMAEHVKYAQWQEAIKAREGLVQNLANAVQRYTYFERQLGKKPDEIAKAIPDLSDLDKDSLDKMKFAMTEPQVALREIPIDIADGGAGTVGSATLGLLGAGDIVGGKKLNSHEAEELNKLELAHALPGAAKALQAMAEALSHIPQFPIDLHFWGLGGTIELGGRQFASAASFAADMTLSEANTMTYEANRASKLGGYTHRERDWAYQSAAAAGEINQIFKQLRAAQIREAMAERELANHREQIKHAEAIEFFLTGEKNADWTQKIDAKAKKTTNQALYTWMKREVKGVYSQSFQLAFDTAKKAERALQHELGNSDLSFLQFGYLSGKEGLLAGEKLYLDIKRMEMAYHDLNQREYELTKHISLQQLDPLALMRLRTTGRCTVRLPEALFDMDGPGHYFRRIRSVAVSVPCVAGPYASVNCTLTLLRSSTRVNPSLRDGAYARLDSQDDRFQNYFGSLQSIVTSSGQSDSGLFDPTSRDERYLPFENSGVISEWELQLPADPSKGDPSQFDYDSIRDVILDFRYTARPGGDLLRNAALANLKALIGDAQAAGSVRLFSVRHEFPTEWARFQSQTPAANQRFELTLRLRDEHYPFWSKGRLKNVQRVDLLARSTQTPLPAVLDVFSNSNAANNAKKGTLAKDTSLGSLLVGPLTADLPATPTGDVKLFLDTRAVSDVWLAVTWSG
ncbi:MAG: insecticidal toxin protein [Anaerolineae bacterium]